MNPHRFRLGRRLALLAPFLLLGLPPAHAAPDPSEVTIRPVDGAAVEGRLRALNLEEVVVDAAGGRRRFPLGAVRALSFPAAPAAEIPPDSEGRVRIHLVGGEVLIGRLGEPAPDGIRLISPDFGELEVSFDVVRSVAPLPAKADPCYEPERRHPAGETDLAHVRGGDAYAGIVLTAGRDGVQIEASSGRIRTIPLADLIVVHFENEWLPPAGGLVVEVDTAGGSRFVSTASLSFADGTLTLASRSLTGVAVTLPRSRMRELRARGDRFIYASDLPFESEFTSFYPPIEDGLPFGEWWNDARRDRRPEGCPLKLAGVVYRHGIAAHAQSRIAIPLERKWRTFRTLFGVDDEAIGIRPGGIVDARVRADGKVVWEGKDIRAGEAPRSIGPLDVSDVDVLQLEVDFGAEQQAGDRATWADPVLERR